MDPIHLHNRVLAIRNEVGTEIERVRIGAVTGDPYLGTLRVLFDTLSADLTVLQVLFNTKLREALE